MKNFEDIARERILEDTLEHIKEGAAIDKNDVEVFAGMIYALLRAGARREGQEGFQKAFAHFVMNGRTKPSDDELEIMRGALLTAVERFSLEARALHVYFNAIDHEGASEDEATLIGMEVLDGERM